MPASPLFDDLLTQLISVDTTSRNSNLEAIDVLAESLDVPAVDCRIHRTTDNKANLVAVTGPATHDPEHGLVLCGHSDTVPAEEPGWQCDPFTLTSHEDRWVGRGTADMKGFLALACERLAAWSERDLEAPLALVVTHDEEVGSLGAEALVTSGAVDDLPQSMIIGEPTELKIHRLHKGHLRLALTVHGQAGHSAYPQRGVNAVVEAARVVVALEELAIELRRELTSDADLFGEVPYTVLHPATAHGGDAINVIAESCRIEIGVRVLPGTDPEQLVERVQSAAVGATSCPIHLEQGRFSPPMATSEDSPLVLALLRASGESAASGVHFSSDGGFFSQAGFDCVLYGPGSISVAHRANEFLPRADVENARGTLDRVIADLCGGDR